MSPLAPALSRLRSRRTQLRVTFPDLRDEWIDQFAEYLIESGQGYAHVDTTDVGGVVTAFPAEWRAELDTMLGQFGKIGSGEQVSGLNAYEKTFGRGATPSKRRQCWWYCGGGRVDEFDPAD